MQWFRPNLNEIKIAISTSISGRLIYPSICCALNSKRLCEIPFPTWSGCVLLQHHFVELRETGSRRVSCQLYFICCYRTHCIVLAVKLGFLFISCHIYRPTWTEKNQHAFSFNITKHCALHRIGPCDMTCVDQSFREVQGLVLPVTKRKSCDSAAFRTHSQPTSTYRNKMPF